MDAPDDQYLLHDTDQPDLDTNPDDDDRVLDEDDLAEVLGDASVIRQIVDRTLEGGDETETTF